MFHWTVGAKLELAPLRRLTNNPFLNIDQRRNICTVLLQAARMVAKCNRLLPVLHPVLLLDTKGTGEAAASGASSNVAPSVWHPALGVDWQHLSCLCRWWLRSPWSLQQPGCGRGCCLPACVSQSRPAQLSQPAEALLVWPPPGKMHRFHI